jgi:hypothetical protein
MTMRVTMRDPRRGENGLSMLLTGQTYTVSDDYGKFLVSLGAVDTDNVIAQREFAKIDQVVSDEARAIRALVSSAWISPTPNANNATAAEFNRAMIQTAIDAGGVVNIVKPGVYYVSDTLFGQDYATLDLGAGVKIIPHGTYRKTVITTLNAHWWGDAAAPAGIAILGATDNSAGTAGTGTVRVASKTMYYTAPGDTEGAGVVAVAGTGDQGTGTARYELVSGDGVRKLYVTAVYGSLSTASGSVRIHKCSGAKTVSWTRDGSVCTVTETAHGRDAADGLGLYGANFLGQQHILNVTDVDTWTMLDTRTAGSGTGAVLGRKSFSITGPGTIDYGCRNTVAPVLRSINDAHAVLALCVSDFTFGHGETQIRQSKKYGIYCQVTSRLRIDMKFYADAIGPDSGNPYTSTAAYQLNGKNFDSVCSVVGKSTDTLTALCISDYPAQCFFLSSDFGNTDTSFTTLPITRGIGGSHHDVIRLAGCRNSKFRHTVIGEVYTDCSNTTSTALLFAFADPYLHNAGECIWEGLHVKKGAWTQQPGSTIHTASISLWPEGSTPCTGTIIEGLELDVPARTETFGAILLGSSAAGSGGIIADLTIRNCYTRNNKSWQGTLLHKMQPTIPGVTPGSGAVTVGRLQVSDNFLQIDNAAHTSWMSNLVSIAASNWTIDSLYVERNRFIDVSSAGTKSFLFYSWPGDKGGFKVAKLTDNYVAGNGTGLLNHQSTTYAMPKITVDGLHIGPSTSYGVILGAPAILNVGNWHSDDGGVYRSIFVIYSSGAASDIQSMGGNNVKGSDTLSVTVSGSVQPSVNGIDLAVDLSTIARTAGRIVRTAVSKGTIPANVLAVCDASGTTNSWKALHNTTLVY